MFHVVQESLGECQDSSDDCEVSGTKTTTTTTKVTPLSSNLWVQIVDEHYSGAPERYGCKLLSDICVALT